VDETKMAAADVGKWKQMHMGLLLQQCLSMLLYRNKPNAPGVVTGMPGHDPLAA